MTAQKKFHSEDHPHEIQMFDHILEMKIAKKIKLKNAQIQARHNLCTGLLFVISTERFFYKKLKAFLDIYAKNVIMHFNLTRFSDFKGKIFNFYAASNVFA